MDVLVVPGPATVDLGAVATARVMVDAWRRRRPRDRVVGVPMGDGGAGLVEVLHATLGGRLMAVTVPGPLGSPVPAPVLLLPARGSAEPSAPAPTTPATAVVEADQVLGEHLVEQGERAAAVSRGTSEGVGLLVRAALETGAGRIVVGSGPSPVHDAGAGALRGLGLPGTALGAGSTGLGRAGPADLAGLAELRAVLRTRDLVVACARSEPLVGLHGAGATLTARTGIDPASAQEADRSVARFAELLAAGVPVARVLPLAAVGAGAATAPATARRGLAAVPGTGVGGGVGLAMACLGARLVEGARVVADLVGLAELAAAADLVVTACRRLDAAALTTGVVPVVAQACARSAVPVVVVSDEVEVSRRELAGAGVTAAYPLRDRPGPFVPPRAWGEAGDGPLGAKVERIAATWSPA